MTLTELIDRLTEIREKHGCENRRILISFPDDDSDEPSDHEITDAEPTFRRDAVILEYNVKPSI